MEHILVGSKLRKVEELLEQLRAAQAVAEETFPMLVNALVAVKSAGLSAGSLWNIFEQPAATSEDPPLSDFSFVHLERGPYGD
jgi:hypothetical protein